MMVFWKSKIFHLVIWLIEKSEADFFWARYEEIQVVIFLILIDTDRVAQRCFMKNSYRKIRNKSTSGEELFLVNLRP